MKPGEIVEEADGSEHKCVCDGSSCLVVVEGKPLLEGSEGSYHKRIGTRSKLLKQLPKYDTPISSLKTEGRIHAGE